MSFDFGDIGNDISSWFGNAASGIGNLFSGGGSTPDSSASLGAPTNTDGSGAASGNSSDTGGFNLFNSTPTTGTSSFTAPTSTGYSNLGATTAPSTASNLDTFLAGGTAPATGGQSALSAPDTGLGNTSSVLSTSNANPTAAVQTPSTLQSIMQSLGLGGASAGDLAKGLAGAGGLAYSAIKDGGSSSAEKAVKGMAANANTQGQQLESYLANGTLPPGAQQYVDAQSAAKKASIQSEYAQLGMSGSTAEAQELANVDTQAQAQMFQIATQLYNSGVSQTGASSTLYNTLMNAQNQDNTDIGNAINGFISSLGGMATPTKTGA